MRTVSSIRSAALAGALALTLVACGGSDEPSTEVGETGGTEALETVTIGVTSLNSLHLWMIMARDENLMEPAGVELDVITFQNTGQILPAIISGEANFGFVTPEQLFAAQDAEPGLKMVAAEITNNPYSVIVTPEIADLEGLRGTTIGVTGAGASADYFTAKLLLQDAGLEEGTDYTFVNAGPPPERASAMAAGQLQAVLNFPPSTQILLDEGMQVIAQASDNPNLDQVILSSLVSDEGWYSENREAAVKFMRGYLDTVAWMYDPANRDAAVGHIAAEMGIDTEDAEITYDTFVTELQASPLDGVIDPEFLQTTVDNARQAGLATAPTDDSLADRYDNSLVEEAAELD